MTTMPTRVDGELFEDAKQAAALHSRSASQQIDHWARIGREFEAAGLTTHRAVEEVLSGRRSYDALSDEAQAVVRAAWDQRIEERISSLDFTHALDAAGAPWAENDETGALVIRHPSREG